jgi:hypothetical protein
LAELDLFLYDDTDQQLKSGHHPLLIPNIPYFHHSIISLFIEQYAIPLGVNIKAWSLGQDSLLDTNCYICLYQFIVFLFKKINPDVASPLSPSGPA